jgi:hypothetical protein
MAHADTALLLFLAAAAVAAVRGTPLPHACGKTRHGSITGSAVKDASSGLWRFVNGVEPGVTIMRAHKGGARCIGRACWW